MSTQSFSIMQAIDFGFRMFARNFWLLLGLSFAGAAVQFGADVINTMIFTQSGLASCQKLTEESKSTEVDLQPGEEERHTIGRAFGALFEKSNMVHNCYKQNILTVILMFLIKLLTVIFVFVLLMGWNRIALDLYDTGISSFNRIFVTLPFFFTYLIALILYSFITLGGLLLLIIPGIIWALKYSFFDLIIIDTGCGPIEALRKSGQLTYGHKWRLFLFGLFSIFLVAISSVTIIIPFILGNILTLSRAYIYRTLQGGTREHA